MRADPRLLFVYGTLRKGAEQRMGRWLAQNADFVGSGFFQGVLYLVADYPGLVPSDLPQDRTRGDIFLLPRLESILARLDRYEGYGPTFPTPNEFIRARGTARFANNDPLVAWVYLYNRAVDNLPRIASGDFLRP